MREGGGSSSPSYRGDSDVTAAQRGQVNANVATFNGEAGPPLLRGAAMMDGAHKTNAVWRAGGGGGGRFSPPRLALLIFAGARG